MPKITNDNDYRVSSSLLVAQLADTMLRRTLEEKWIWGIPYSEMRETASEHLDDVKVKIGKLESILSETHLDRIEVAEVVADIALSLSRLARLCGAFRSPHYGNWLLKIWMWGMTPSNFQDGPDYEENRDDLVDMVRKWVGVRVQP